LLESLQPEIFLAYHSDDFSFPAKRERAASEGAEAFVDPEGYRRFIAGRKAKLEQCIALE
jgi:metallo-beta-lactamase class B